MEVQLEAEIAAPELDPEIWCQRLCRAMARMTLPSDTVLAVRVVSDEIIQAINREHRDLDRPTDVLSFPMYERTELEGILSGSLERDPGPLLLGDLVVSWETCARQAADYGHGLDREFGFLLAHGLLHLMGDDHEDPDDEARMRARQRQIMADWGLSLETA
ncbi:MAG: rRNA maturation RNase YbeY [Candidatus Sericytochromatia bacterium]|nr:rRNA maturation RNase YbeY [Candidatus Sericytochromatia bacterium]